MRRAPRIVVVNTDRAAFHDVTILKGRPPRRKLARHPLSATEGEYDTLRPTAVAIEAYVDHIRRGLPGTVSTTGRSSWYLGADGRPELWPYHRRTICGCSNDPMTAATSWQAASNGTPRNLEPSSDQWVSPSSRDASR